MIIHHGHIEGSGRRKNDATVIRTTHRGDVPLVKLSTRLPLGREDLALALAEYLQDTITMFLHDYREDLVMPGDRIEPHYVEGEQ